MKVLVIGSGGREHAIVWKLMQSPKLTKLYAAPGNPGISSIAECINFKAGDINGLLHFSKENHIDLTVVGPEVPLGLGIVDEFNSAGLKIFGPSKNAARLETSKIFAKDFMFRNHIPTSKYRAFNTDTKTEAMQYLNSIGYPVVIKADGLAAGKGVIICSDKQQAFSAVNELFENKIFGAAGDNIVVEEFLEGTEASVFAVCDGENYVVLPPAQDHKKIGDGESGKNTGGMGSFAPAEKIVTDELLDKVMQRVIEPVLHGMNTEGYSYSGCLYCGLMIDKYNDPYVIEFNVRFGDPETQVVLPLIKTDFLELLYAASTKKLADFEVETYNRYYTCVVLASNGYPDSYESGKLISGYDRMTDNSLLFHAGTKLESGRLISSGGRVLNVVGYSENSLKESIDTAYKNAAIIQFENKYYRTDIGLKGI
ncbi:MAG TPA: phosphoribosylamine--glycine ligase [Ignavibacteria bacterium]|nr:phosphoribosylamine--glycine ligase [Ignavibacteria bacterium]